uniref:glycine--tRNA ligase n=1 Tax=Biomphalaria glabrata TaxID=6526 RepID=A0A2C9L8G4_BIOGL
QRILSFKNALEKVLESEKLFVNVDLIEVSEIALGVEFPNLICVDLDKTLMLSLPNIITVNVIEKYGFIALYNDSGVLSNKVVTVINVKPSDVIVNGYRQMIEARLMDALHAWRYSMSVDVEALEGRLSKMLFYNSLGTVAEKIHRITVLAKYLTIWIPHVNIIEVEKAARLSKLDLTMEIVNEFPSLQGEIGAIYAKNNGASDLVSDAIREHYLPHGMSGPMPMTAEGITLSIADKLDTIVGFFIINKIPTSSQDPLGLRRAVLSIIRTTIHHNIDVPFSIVVYKAIQNYPRSLYKTRFHTKIIETIALIAHKKHDSEESHSNDISYIRKSVIEFFKERFISVISSEYSISSDIALSVLN